MKRLYFILIKLALYFIVMPALLEILENIYNQHHENKN